jgi:hypothetical protein
MRKYTSPHPTHAPRPPWRDLTRRKRILILMPSVGMLLPTLMFAFHWLVPHPPRWVTIATLLVMVGLIFAIACAALRTANDKVLNPDRFRAEQLRRREIMLADVAEDEALPNA